jgi:hypothetical protein
VGELLLAARVLFVQIFRQLSNVRMQLLMTLVDIAEHLRTMTKTKTTRS